jgi:hypothetical protein
METHVHHYLTIFILLQFFSFPLSMSSTCGDQTYPMILGGTGDDSQYNSLDIYTPTPSIVLGGWTKANDVGTISNTYGSLLVYIVDGAIMWYK